METTFFTFDFSFWFIPVVLIIGLLTFTVYNLRNSLRALKEEVRKNTDHRKNNSSKSITEINNTSNNDLTNVMRRLSKIEDYLIAKPVDITYSPAVPVNIPAPVVEDEKPFEINLSVPEKPKVTEFYMSTPSPDSSFEADQGSDSFRNTISLYKFTVNANNPAKATFMFDSDAVGISDSLNNPKTFIEPVCYQANDAFPGARQIITTQPGTAEKRNNKWVVVDKAKIKYQ